MIGFFPALIAVTVEPTPGMGDDRVGGLHRRGQLMSQLRYATHLTCDELGRGGVAPCWTRTSS